MPILNFVNFVNEQVSPGEVPSHEELESLEWFGHFKHLLASLDKGVQWATGAKAYANGTRALVLNSGIHPEKKYLFYPLKRTVYFGATSILRDINLRSLIDWNSAFERMWMQKVSQILGISRHQIVRTAVEKGDITQFEKWIEKANRDYAMAGKELPDSLLLAIEETMLLPEEAEAIRYLRSVGLIR